jgi:hypothetical protein
MVTEANTTCSTAGFQSEDTKEPTPKRPRLQEGPRSPPIITYPEEEAAPRSPPTPTYSLPSESDEEHPQLEVHAAGPPAEVVLQLAPLVPPAEVAPLQEPQEEDPPPRSPSSPTYSDTEEDEEEQPALQPQLSL